MRGIYISNMEMPKDCSHCVFSRLSPTGENLICCIDCSTVVWDGKPFDCPLIEVPEHGRLIDADALHALFEEQWHYLQILNWKENPTAEAKQSGISWCINTMHDNAPIVIPADKEANE